MKPVFLGLMSAAIRTKIYFAKHVKHAAKVSCAFV